MLSKEERKAIAERLNKCEGLSDLYYAVIGDEAPTITSYEQDIDTLFTRLADLCDTSNMLELPLDKDGEVIHINDVIYDNSGEEYQVECIKFFDIGAGVAIRNDGDYTITQPGRLTHKNPVTAKSLAQRIKHVLEDEATSIGVSPYVELGRIAEQLESLGDSGEE